MSKVSEIKCPVCEKWCNWTSKIDERCPNCDAQLDAGRFQYEEEKKIRAAHIRKNSYLLIKDNEDPVVQMFKEFVNWLRWATFYGISVIYVAIAFMLVMFGLVML